MTGFTGSLKNYSREYDYNEYAYTSCFTLLSCTGRNTRSECANTGTIWQALDLARLLENSFFLWHTYWKFRFGIMFRAMHSYQSILSSSWLHTDYLSVFLCNIVIYPIFVLLLCKGILLWLHSCLEGKVANFCILV